MSAHNEYNEISLVDIVQVLRQRYKLFLAVFFCGLIVSFYFAFVKSFIQVKLSRQVEVAHFFNANANANASVGIMAYPIADQSANYILGVLKPVLKNEFPNIKIKLSTSAVSASSAKAPGLLLTLSTQINKASSQQRAIANQQFSAILDRLVSYQKPYQQQQLSVWRTTINNYTSLLKRFSDDKSAIAKPASLNKIDASSIVSNTAAFDVGVGIAYHRNMLQTMQTTVQLQNNLNRLQQAEKTLQAPRFVQPAYTMPPIKLPFVVLLLVGFMLSLFLGMVVVAVVQLFSASRQSIAQ